MKYLLLFTSLLLLPCLVYSQDSIPKPGALNFFLDCRECDFNFVRVQLPFVSFVRNPQLADVHILVTNSRTGGGGDKFYLNFLGLKTFSNLNYEYEVITSQSDTDDDVRKALLKMIKVGILPYYSRTSFIDNLNIDIEESENRNTGTTVTDKWKNWVFTLSSGAQFQKEESQNEYSIDSEVSASKVTEKWKSEIEAFYEINRENFYDEGVKIVNSQDSREMEASLIRSISEKWSAGAFAGYSSRTFLNIKNNFSIGAGIQYNFFPWKESNRRVFSIGYVIGVDSYEYNETTIYDMMRETHPVELLIMELDMNQPWGEVSVELQGRNYIHDFSKSRLSLEADLSVRLTRNLSVYCNIESQLIHDQLYLPKGDASLEDILLRRRKLATTYEVRGHLGLRFTFGSIFNNVVNERFNMRY